MNLGWIAFGVGEAAIGLAMIMWPRGMPRGGQRARTDSVIQRQIVLTQRAIGMLLLVMGGVITHSGLSANGTDASGPGEARTASLIFAALWALVGVVMVLWPERVRSITKPNHAASSGLTLAASALMSYRLTGVGFIVIGVIAGFMMLSAGK